MRKERYRIISQVKIFDENDNAVTLNAGESLPEGILSDKKRIAELIQQGRVCQMDENGLNIETPTLDELEREIKNIGFIHNLANPRRVNEATDFLKHHHIAEDNLILLKDKIETALSFNPKIPFGEILELIRGQFDEIRAQKAQRFSGAKPPIEKALA